MPSKKIKYLIQSFIPLLVLSGCITTTQDDFNAGSYIDISGKISETPWQHMIEPPESYQYTEYIDLNDGDQIVVYSKETINCDGDINVKGEVIEINGTSKRPGSDEEYKELQLLADEFECYN